MQAKTPASTGMKFKPRTRQTTEKRVGFAAEFGLKVAAAALGAVGLACAMLCTYLYQSSGYAIPANPAFYFTLKIIESAWRAAHRPSSGLMRRRPPPAGAASPPLLSRRSPALARAQP